MSNNAHWQFPPRNGGIEYIQDPSSDYFSDDPLPKLAREAIQNSLDAKLPELNRPVQVVFAEIFLKPEVIGANELRRHLEACRDRAKEDKRPPNLQIYEYALGVLKSKRIRCLKIVDSGTSGLKGKNWDALVSQEGSVEKVGEAPGGSYGIGKNAVFNVSDLRTVFYSTRYVSRGRVEKLQGKATLMAHSDPNDKQEQLQHIGFFALPDVKPIIGKSIPLLFRLEDTGTGVFVMGFNPRSEQWAEELVDATISNFFHAIHHKELVVKVRTSKSEETTINHETLDPLFEKQGRKAPSYFYYKAVRDEKPAQTKAMGNIGPLDVYVLLEASGPRRTAYVNRNGMLITDVRDQKFNPIGPRGRNLWPDFATVVVPATAKGDQWIRRTENPSHDSMSPGKFFDEKERRDAGKWFKAARDSIVEIVDKRAEIQRFGDQSNLDELASMFPDEFDPDAPGNKVLKTRVSRTRVMAIPPGLGPGISSGAGSDAGSGVDVGTGDGNGGGGGGGNGNGNGDGTGTPPNVGPGVERGARSTRTPRLQRPRLIPTGPSRATVAFTIAEPVKDQIRLRIIPTGGEWTREDKVEITQARVISPAGQQVQVDDGALFLSPNVNERVVIEVTTSKNMSDLAFRIG